MTVLDSRRMSEADRAGLAARSPEGHAAKSMHIRGREEEWIQIQEQTFSDFLEKLFLSFVSSLLLLFVIFIKMSMHSETYMTYILSCNCSCPPPSNIEDKIYLYIFRTSMAMLLLNPVIS